MVGISDFEVKFELKLRDPSSWCAGTMLPRENVVMCILDIRGVVSTTGRASAQLPVAVRIRMNVRLLHGSIAEFLRT